MTAAVRQAGQPASEQTRLAGEGNLPSLKRQLVREEILAVATRLFAAEGVRSVSIDKVASGLGYTKSSVYYYFASKDDLLWGVFSYISDRFVGEAERIALSTDDPAARLSELVQMHVRFLAAHKDWATIFYRDVSMLPAGRQAEVRSIMVRYDAFFRQAVREGIDKGVFLDMPPDIVAKAILGACNWMANWVSAWHQEHTDSIVDVYVRLFTQGLIVRVPEPPMQAVAGPE